MEPPASAIAHGTSGWIYRLRLQERVHRLELVEATETFPDVASIRKHSFELAGQVGATWEGPRTRWTKSP